MVFVDLGRGRLGASALEQAFLALQDRPPDLDHPHELSAFFSAVQSLNRSGLLLAYHDRSDGGLVTTICEMAFAGRTGVQLDVSHLGDDPARILFNEELGALVQVRSDDVGEVCAAFAASGLPVACVHSLGIVQGSQSIEINHRGTCVLKRPLSELQQKWSQTSHQLQRLRDDPQCADEEHARIASSRENGLNALLSFDPEEQLPPALALARPRIAILREQGVNGHVEMAAAFDNAGFDAIDVHMSDILAGRVTLAQFKGFAACGGFSYGDVLGGGGGWAGSIRFSERSRHEFSDFFARDDVFGLGVCNGCQMLSRLSDLIPGAQSWPRFLRNRSEQFEARLVLTEVLDSPSVLLRGMVGSVLPTVVAHGEGRADFTHSDGARSALRDNLACLRFVESDGESATLYPANPNGSPEGITGMTTPDGRFTILMPHPERSFRTVQHSWHPPQWGEHGPWMRMFRNARSWLG